MSRIIALPSVEVKRNRVTAPKAVAFADGILDPSDEAIAEGRASGLPTVEGRGLTAAEHAVINREVNAARREVESWAYILTASERIAVVGQVVRAARATAFKAVLAARPKLVPIVGNSQDAAKTAPKPAMMPRGFVTRDEVYIPSAAELDAWCTILDRDEAIEADREIEARYAEHVAYEAMVAGRFSDADMMLVGACG